RLAHHLPLHSFPTRRSSDLAVELKNVTKVFAGGVRAVDSVSIQVPAGKIVALLGTSGCGKTTTLRLINRLEEATSGQVLVRGQRSEEHTSELQSRGHLVCRL